MFPDLSRPVIEPLQAEGVRSLHSQTSTVPLQCGLLGSLQLGLVIRPPYRWPLGSYRMDKSQAVAHTAAYKVIRTNKKQVQGLNACIP